MNLVEKIIESKISRHGINAIAFFTILAILVISYLEDKIWFEKTFGFKIDGLLKGFLLLILLVLLVEFFLWLFGDILIPVYRWLESKITNKTIVTIPDISKWIYQGSLKIQEVLEITAANSGCLSTHAKPRALARG